MKLEPGGGPLSLAFRLETVKKLTEDNKIHLPAPIKLINLHTVYIERITHDVTFCLYYACILNLLSAI